MKLKAKIEVGMDESYMVWNGKRMKLPDDAHKNLVEAYEQDMNNNLNFILHGHSTPIQQTIP